MTFEARVQEKRWQPGDAISRARLQDLIRLTSQQLLSPAGFGYSGDYSVADPNPWTRSYIGLDRRRNFWHDAWVVLALARARAYDTGTAGADEVSVKSLLTQMVGLYGLPDGTIAHWAPEHISGQNVRYCGDNALFYAICAELQWAPEPQGGRHGGTFAAAASEAPSPTQQKINLKKSQKGFWDFVGKLRSRDAAGLASVGDVYPQVRLHANSELAALLLWRLL